ncbi:hypothetical protein LguiB_036395 [Lonicera macranthoides]
MHWEGRNFFKWNLINEAHHVPISISVYKTIESIDHIFLAMLQICILNLASNICGFGTSGLFPTDCSNLLIEWVNFVNK